MIKRIVVFLMIGQLLAGSVLLPLGDFSLWKELPRMYQDYARVVSPDDKGVLDFVGDYLFGGKSLLGHNQRDQPLKPGAMQFQHTATFAMMAHPQLPMPSPVASGGIFAGCTTHLPGTPSDYHPSLFRPPLA